MEERTDNEQLTDWAARLEEEMRPPLARLGDHLGDLVDGLVGGLSEGGLFQQAFVDKRDGEGVVTGDHSLGLGPFGLVSAGDFGGLQHQLSDLGPTFSSSFSSSSSSFPSFSSSSSFSSSNGGSLGEMQEFDPFSIFGIVRRKWYEGEGVCTEREVVDEEEVESRQGGLGALFNMDMVRSTQCRDQPDMRECKTEVTEGGVRKTIVERHVCCHGHRRTPGSIGCQEVVLEPLLETVQGLGGREFLALVEDQALVDRLAGNVTVFLPSDEAIEDFHHDLQSLNSVNKEGLLERRRRSPPTPQELPSLKEVLLGHLVPSMISTNSMSDEGEVETMATSGSKIRLTVYNTFPQKVVMANCARVTSADHMAKDGLVHMVDKVLLPATRNVVDLMRTELKTGSFLNALSKVDGLLEELEGEGQFTVFAPTDKAMEALEPALKRMLEEGKDCSGEVVRLGQLLEIFE